MEGNTTQAPKPGPFVIAADRGYAMTDLNTCLMATLLVTQLQPVKLEDLDHDDRVCAICQEQFLASEDVTRMACGHVFGRVCITQWLDPLCSWDAFEDHWLETGSSASRLGHSSCPMCRQTFLPSASAQPMELLASRLSFWDMAYASAGAVRSETEEITRNHLWRYVEYRRRSIAFDDDGEDFDVGWELLQYENAQAGLRYFVRSLSTQMLTPEQEKVRKNLERIGRKDLLRIPFENGSFVFDIDRDDNELVFLPRE